MTKHKARPKVQNRRLTLFSAPPSHDFSFTPRPHPLPHFLSSSFSQLRTWHVFFSFSPARFVLLVVPGLTCSAEGQVSDSSGYFLHRNRGWHCYNLTTKTFFFFFFKNVPRLMLSRSHEWQGTTLWTLFRHIVYFNLDLLPFTLQR